MTEKLTLKERAVRGYWSIVGVAGALIFSLQPVLADDIWSRFSTIMKDVYGELVGISTIAAVTAAAVALLIRMISRNQRAVDEATSWLKRIIVTWLVLNTLRLRGSIPTALNPGRHVQRIMDNATMSGGKEVSVVDFSWIFESIVNWVASIVTSIMDAVSGIFLNALGTDMTAMEQYFPFVTEAFSIFQYTAWALLFLITVWQLFRVFGGPVTEAENPWQLLVRSTIFAILIGYAKPIFLLALDIARAPYTALMDATMDPGSFTFAGVEQVLTNGLSTMVSTITVVGPLLTIILMISLGWNYFKMLLECVERYVVVGVLCYTSPLAFSMGGSKTTNNVFKGWTRMVGSQLLLLVLNVWFLRAFNSTVGQFIGNGGALSTGQGSIFLWMFVALAFLKTAQKFDSYLAAMGLNVAQTGSSMGLELLMAARVISGVASGGAKTAGSVFRGANGTAGASGTAATSGGFSRGLCKPL